MSEPPTGIRRRLSGGSAISKDLLPGCDPRQEHTIRRSGTGIPGRRPQGGRRPAVEAGQQDSCHGIIAGIECQMPTRKLSGSKRAESCADVALIESEGKVRA